MMAPGQFKSPLIPTKVGTQYFPAENGLAETRLNASPTHKAGQNWIPTFVGKSGLKKCRRRWKALLLNLLLPPLLALPASAAEPIGPVAPAADPIGLALTGPPELAPTVWGAPAMVAQVPYQRAPLTLAPGSVAAE
ncbi:MAG: hypothetical protein JWM33_3963, partial [Caulobacteraceae bacterium]|nr:hypothetical protein [Caulobacteraceae bacterium]